jgi:hypothetical protein
MFDIVIPLGPNELSRIHQQIKQVKENVIGYRNIYIVFYELLMFVFVLISFPIWFLIIIFLNIFRLL